MDALLPPPTSGRVFQSSRRIRLADRDQEGRLRLDAVMRFLQDVATDDVDETGWGAPEHLWVVRHARIDVLEPVLETGDVELLTWCNGTASLAAGRRLSIVAERGGRIEVDSVWIHLGPDARPARIEGFGVYAASAEGRLVTTRLDLPEPTVRGTAGARHQVSRSRWPIRFADLDVMGHVNNAAYWAAVEECLARSQVETRRPLRACMDHRHPLDLGDAVDVVTAWDDHGAALAFAVEGVTRAVARVDALFETA
jgi:acyl-ACP thioesterase